MKIDFTARHFQLDDRMRGYTEGKLDKLIRFLEEPVDIHVVFEVEKHRQIAELVVSHRHGSLQGKEEANSMFDAVHDVIEKVEKQARRSRKKHTDKRRRAARAINGEPIQIEPWPLDVLAADSVQGGESAPLVIKKTHLPIKPMTVDEAAIQLDGSKNDFFVFLDSASERVSVLYKRRDNNYGLIAPEF